MAVKATLKKYAKRYFIDAMGAMALGLFASLLIGTILSALGMIPGLSILTKIGTYAQKVSGAVMGIAIAYALGAHPLVVFSSAAVGFAANEMGKAGRSHRGSDYCDHCLGDRHAGFAQNQGGHHCHPAGHRAHGRTSGGFPCAPHRDGGRVYQYLHRLGFLAGSTCVRPGHFGCHRNVPDAFPFPAQRSVRGWS